MKVIKNSSIKARKKILSFINKNLDRNHKNSKIDGRLATTWRDFFDVNIS